MESVSEVEAPRIKLAEAGLDEDERFHIGHGGARGRRQRRAARQRIRPRQTDRPSALKTPARTLVIYHRRPGQGASIPETLPDPLAPENLLRGTGRGIFLIRSFMDEVHFRQLHPGTELTLVKHLAPAAKKLERWRREARRTEGRVILREGSRQDFPQAWNPQRCYNRIPTRRNFRGTYYCFP
jgi:serine/threonine-protein kinase RsbW